MPTEHALRSRLFQASPHEVDALALEVLRFQAERCPVYGEWLRALGRDPGAVHRVEDIPFLPVSVFRDHRVYGGTGEPEAVFESSGTTGQRPSRHVVADLGLYRESLLSAFRLVYGDPAEYAIIGLLPSYLERPNASLVHMVKVLQEVSGHSDCGFCLDDHPALADRLARLEQQGQKTLLIGVTFALLDFARQHALPLEHTIVMETGGMKGRGEELTREEVHSRLMTAFRIEQVHSEYGMTELLSQAYATAEGRFTPAPWMKVLVRDPYDPFSLLPPGRTGALNIIDLANLYSCSFIATDDLGTRYPDGTFDVLGRLDHAELRGCNLMLSG